MPHNRNLRGGVNYFFPATDKYRDGHDRIFGCKHEKVAYYPETNKAACVSCGAEPQIDPDLMNDDEAETQAERRQGLETDDGYKAKTYHSR